MFFVFATTPIPAIVSKVSRRAGFTSAANPQYAPINAHKYLLGCCSQRSAKAIMPTRSSVDKQVSQKIVGIQMSGNETAQNVPAR